MELLTLHGKTRPASGKGISRQTRRNGEVPGTLYGGDQSAVNVTVNQREFERLVHGKSGEHAVLQLEVGDKPDLSGPVLLKSVQHHPVRETIIHADFLRIRLDVKLRTQVPVVLVGRAKGIIEGGLADQQLHDIEIECLALDVPPHIELDITDLSIGDSLHVSDIKAAENITILTDPERTIVGIHAPRAVKEATDAAAAEAAPVTAEAEKEKK